MKGYFTLRRRIAVVIFLVGSLMIAVGAVFFVQDLRADGAKPSNLDPSGDSVAELFAEFPELEEVWWFDNQSKGWQIYIEAIHPRTLHYLHVGEPYVFIVSADVAVHGHWLSCGDGICLNLVTWRGAIGEGGRN